MEITRKIYLKQWTSTSCLVVSFANFMMKVIVGLLMLQIFLFPSTFQVRNMYCTGNPESKLKPKSFKINNPLSRCFNHDSISSRVFGSSAVLPYHIYLIHFRLQSRLVTLISDITCSSNPQYQTCKVWLNYAKKNDPSTYLLNYESDVLQSGRPYLMVCFLH